MEHPKYRRIRGGLDNAVRQAEDRGLRDVFVVDVDCHAVEPYIPLAKYLPFRWREEFKNPKLRTFLEHHAKIYDNIFAESMGPIDPKKLRMMMLYLQVMGFGMFDDRNSGRIQRPEIQAYDDVWNFANNGEGGAKTHTVREPTPHWPLWSDFAKTDVEEIADAFTSRALDVGIKRSILFPDIFIDLALVVDKELLVAIANGYMDYMLDNWLGKYREILTPIFAPSTSPDDTAELINRVGSEKGVVGVFVSPASPGPPLGDEYWNPIYEAAQRKNLPVCFHSTSGVNLPPFNIIRRDHMIAQHALSFPFYLAFALTNILLEGVPERFPKLKFAFIEGGISWIPWVMHRLDSEYIMHSSQAPLLRKLPSEYIKKFYFSSQPLERIKSNTEMEQIFQSFSAETQLMYSSDYPHWDFDLPSRIYDLPFLSEMAKRRILGGNASEFFGIR